MSIIQTYHTMIKQIKQIASKERITRVRTMAWLQSVLFHSRSVHLNRIASKLPGQAKKLSVVRRLERFVANPQVRVRTWYQPVSAGLLQAAARAGRPLRLPIDSSRVGNPHQLLMVVLGYRRRALPLAWTWVRCRRGHRTGHKQRACWPMCRRWSPQAQPSS